MDRASVAAVAALDDDVRRRLYEFVRAAGVPVTREAAAEAVGISRKLAAFHLDKLADLGLLRSGFPDAPRRVGRAPRVYEPGAREVAVRVPERTPEVLAEILVDAVLEERPDEPAAAAAVRVARARGARAGEQERAATRGGRIGAERALSLCADVLGRQGYEPYRGPGGVRLRNCPFHQMAAKAPEFVCGLNRAYVEGMVTGLGAEGRVDAVLAPAPGECCVEVRPVR
jgi:predicted ArsR family transcriptional regulator